MARTGTHAAAHPGSQPGSHTGSQTGSQPGSPGPQAGSQAGSRTGPLSDGGPLIEAINATAGYENLRKDFNVFLVGDATLATFPANSSPRFATNAAISFASLENLITQVSWIKYEPR